MVPVSCIGLSLSYCPAKAWCANADQANALRPKPASKKPIATLLIVDLHALVNCGNCRVWLFSKRTWLLTDHMSRILVVLVTNVFPNLLTRSEIGHLPDFPGLRKRSRIFVGNFQFQMSQVRPADPCDHTQLFGVGKVARRNPSLIIKTECIHNQRDR